MFKRLFHRRHEAPVALPVGPPRMRDTLRLHFVTLEFSDMSMQRLVRMKNLTGAPTLSAVFAEALDVYEAAIELSEADDVLVLENEKAPAGAGAGGERNVRSAG